MINENDCESGPIQTAFVGCFRYDGNKRELNQDLLEKERKGLPPKSFGPQLWVKVEGSKRFHDLPAVIMSASDCSFIDRNILDQLGSLSEPKFGMGTTFSDSKKFDLVEFWLYVADIFPHPVKFRFLVSENTLQQNTSGVIGLGTDFLELAKIWGASFHVSKPKPMHPN